MKIQEKYQVISQIGLGAFSQVYLVQDVNLGSYWAMKIIDKKIQGSYQGIKEANLLKNLCHPSIPRVVELEETRDQVILVMDYIKGPSLEQLLKTSNIKKEQALSLARQLVDLISYLNHRNPPIYYLDLKPEHLIICKERMYLIDFGSAISNQDSTTSFSGTHEYSDPVLFQGQGPNDTTDLYSLGKILSQLLMKAKIPKKRLHYLAPLKNPNPTKRKRTHEDLILFLQSLQEKKKRKPNFLYLLILLMGCVLLSPKSNFYISSPDDSFVKKSPKDLLIEVNAYTKKLYQEKFFHTKDEEFILSRLENFRQLKVEVDESMEDQLQEIYVKLCDLYFFCYEYKGPKTYKEKMELLSYHFKDRKKESLVLYHLVDQRPLAFSFIDCNDIAEKEEASIYHLSSYEEEFPYVDDISLFTMEGEYALLSIHAQSMNEIKPKALEYYKKSKGIKSERATISLDSKGYCQIKIKEDFSGYYYFKAIGEDGSKEPEFVKSPKIHLVLSTEKTEKKEKEPTRKEMETSSSRKMLETESQSPQVKEERKEETKTENKEEKNPKITMQDFIDYAYVDLCQPKILKIKEDVIYVFDDHDLKDLNAYDAKGCRIQTVKIGPYYSLIGIGKEDIKITATDRSGNQSLLWLKSFSI